MRDNFIRVAAATPEIKVADVAYNKEQICACVEEAAARKAQNYRASGTVPDWLYMQ